MLRAADKSTNLGRLSSVVPQFFPVSAATVGALTASSSGTTIDTTAGNNAESSWQEIVASSSIDADGFILAVSVKDTGILSFLLDIGVGAAASEVEILQNLLFSSGGADNGAAYAYIPLPIPAGSRIAGRVQGATTTSATLGVIITLVKGGMARRMRLSRATTYGADTSDSGGVQVDPGGSANTKPGTWTQIAASLTYGFECCLVCIGGRGNATASAQNCLLDIGIGGSGSEVAIAENLYYRYKLTEDIVPQWIWLPVSAKAGQRLSARAQSSSTDATDRIVDVAVVGFS